jgi:hypothetical protein
VLVSLEPGSAAPGICCAVRRLMNARTPRRFRCFQNGSPFSVVTLDISNLDERKDEFTYTDEEVIAKYGPGEGKEFGADVQICGQKLPKQRAYKFMKYSGPKVAAIFGKLSFEERHALMTGSAKLPQDVMQDSLSEYWRGSEGKKCDGCAAAPKGETCWSAAYNCYGMMVLLCVAGATSLALLFMYDIEASWCRRAKLRRLW